MKIVPLGSKMIVLPKERETFKTESGIDVVQNDLLEGIVMEVSDEYFGIYKKGDTVLYEGNGITEMYDGKTCSWIDGRTVKEGGNVWAILK